jgi:hypothetical protein
VRRAEKKPPRPGRSSALGKGTELFCLRVVWGAHTKLRPACAKLASVVQICVGFEIISARDVGARNLGCAGNNRLGHRPHSERCFAS